jgi:glutaconate CoA-transferase subunit A
VNKVGSLDDLVDRFNEVDTVCFGGGGLSRKAMSAAAAISIGGAGPRSFYSLLGGPEVDLLIGSGNVRDLHFAYLGLDSVGLAPNFRHARESGSLPIVESSEYLVLAGLEAAARGVPFLPTRSGLGTDVLSRPNSPYTTFDCPVTGELLVASPAIRPDLAIFHVNLADQRGNAVIYGEAFADFLLARAARSVWITTEHLVDSLPPMDQRPHGTFIPRLLIDGVVHAPRGADFTGIYPDYPVDYNSAEQYRMNASDPIWLRNYAEGVSALSRKVVDNVS